MDPVYGYQAVNVEAQLANPSSLLHWMRNMIALRKLFKVFGRGTMEFLPVDNRKVLAYIRRYEEDVHPLRREPLALRAARRSSTSRRSRGSCRSRCSATPSSRASAALPYFLTLGPYGFYWFELRRPG